MFPLPGLRTKKKYQDLLRTVHGGHDVFYMRPSRYYSGRTSLTVIVDHLVYVMQCMMEKEKNCTEGISFLANMDGWTMENFDLDYCYHYMQILQGNILPIKVNLFLMVNPPKWFGAVWKIMKQMLCRDFQKKVRMIPESKLSIYLEDGYEQYLPNEMTSGTASTSQLVLDFVKYRMDVESTDSKSSLQ